MSWKQEGYRERETSQGHPGTEFQGNPRAEASAAAPPSAGEQGRMIQKCPSPTFPSTAALSG